MTTYFWRSSPWRLRAALLVALASLASCASPAPPRPASAGSSAAAQPSPGVSWSELTVSWDYGPCDPNAPRSCHQSVRVTSDGQVLQTETPNPGVSPTPKTRASTLAPPEASELARLIDAPFVAGMKSGFPCSQPTPDASITFALVTEGKRLTQDVTPCLRDGVAPNAPQRVMKLVEPYRFVR